MRFVLLVFWLLCIKGWFCPFVPAQTVSVNRELRVHSGYRLDSEEGLQALIDSNRHWESKGSDTGLQLYQSIVRECKRLQYDRGTAVGSIILGNIAINQGKFKEAISYFEEALGLCLSDKASLGQYLSLIYNNTGNAYRSIGDMDRASSCFFKALQAAENISGSKCPPEKIYLNMSGRLQDAGKKLYYLNKADSIARRAGNKEVLAVALINKSIALAGLKRYAEGERALRELLYISDTSDNGLMKYRALTRLGAQKNYQDQPDSALLLLRRAARVFPGGEPDVFQSNVNYLTWGSTFLKLKQYSEAVLYADSALQGALSLGLPEQAAHAHGLLADIYAAAGQHKNAYEHQVLFKALQDSVMNKEVAHNISNLEARYQSVRKDKALAESRLVIRQNYRVMTLLAITSAALLLLSLLAFRYFRNRQRLLLQQQENQQLRALIQGEEQERSRLARELHDGVGGMLVAISMKLGAARKDNPALLLSEMDGMLRDASTELRNAAHNLMPDVLDRHSLKEALQLFCDRINASAVTRVAVQCYDIDYITDKNLTLLLYRIIQELVQNILRHAEARHAEIQLMRYGSLLTLTVEDDGKGFDVQQQSKGSGLYNIRTRLQVLQGELSISSQSQKGTTVHIELDLDKL